MTIKDRIRGRMYVMLTLLALLPVAVGGQVLWLYGTQGAQLRKLGKRQARTVQEIPAMRGAIVDRSGRPLVVNTARYVVALDPTIEGFEERKDTFFDKLSKLSGVPADVFRRRVQQRASVQYARLLWDVPEALKDELVSWEVPGLILEPQFDRQYSYGALAEHLLGYVSSDMQGLAGIELQYDEYLRGTPGWRTMQRNRFGLVQARVGGRVVEPQHGQRLVLTIDLVRQAIMEDELSRGVRQSGARWGTAIAVNPETGAILAMATAPGFNPNTPGRYPKAQRRNRAITDQIEPGSTFKLVTAVAALEQGIIELDDSLETGDGWTMFYGRTMKDVHAYGTISFSDAIVYSSNVGISKTAVRLDPGVFYQYARNLGFGQATGIDLPGEVSGLLKKPSEWSGTTQPWMSIGYEVLVTPLQLVMAYGALANEGKLMQPYVVAERRDMAGNTLWKAEPTVIRQAFSPETAELLIPVFERVVEEGTGELAQVEGLRIAGKTGTANKVVGGEYAEGTRASFVGFFPAGDPKVVMVVVLDEPQTSSYGGQVAAPIFQNIARRWIGTFPELAAQRVDVGDDGGETKATAIIPDLTGQPAALAVQRLKARGLQVQLSGASAPEDIVASQVPKGGAVIEVPGEVELHIRPPTGMDPAVMPDVRGLSMRQAVAWLRARDISVSIHGVGTVARQQPAPGRNSPNHAILYGQ